MAILNAGGAGFDMGVLIGFTDDGVTIGEPDLTHVVAQFSDGSFQTFYWTLLPDSTGQLSLN